MLSAYAIRPTISFEGQDPNEKILLLLRSHPITNFPWLILVLAITIFPFFVPKFLAVLGIDINLIPLSFQLILLILNYLLGLLVFLEGFLNWYYNAILVTNEKIVDIDFEHLLYKAVNLAPLHKIEETDSVTAGILGSLFDFGSVRVQTAGENIAIEMKNIPHSALVADMVLDLAGKPHQHVLGTKSD